MTGADSRRRRIVRIRSVERRIAQLELAKARGNAAQIASIVERIEALRAENSTSEGTTSGQWLAAMSELGIQLEQARRATAEPLTRAQEMVRHRQAGNIEAQRKEDGANHLFEKARRRNETQAELRASANRCYRQNGEGNEQ
jgi:hypothetical protein